MRTGISITITRSVRGRLEAITRDRNASQKHAWRAAIILSSADGVGTNEIMRRTGKSKTCVWRWQERFMKEGIDGLLHSQIQALDRTQPGLPLERGRLGTMTHDYKRHGTTTLF